MTHALALVVLFVVGTLVVPAVGQTAEQTKECKDWKTSWPATAKARMEKRVGLQRRISELEEAEEHGSATAVRRELADLQVTWALNDAWKANGCNWVLLSADKFREAAKHETDPKRKANHLAHRGFRLVEIQHYLSATDAFRTAAGLLDEKHPKRRQYTNYAELANHAAFQKAEAAKKKLELAVEDEEKAHAEETKAKDKSKSPTS
ncbi:MAG: hypothetical protein RIF41_24840 [Polyangiaceae bacterium]